MIEPWQVWLADLSPVEGHEQSGIRPVLVISSSFHLRLQTGRMVTVSPLTGQFQSKDYRVQIRNHHSGDSAWVITDQVRTISTSRFQRSTPWWTLKDYEIANVQRALSAMVDF